MSERNPYWLLYKEWNKYKVEEIGFDLQERGVFIEGDSSIRTHLTRWDEEVGIDCSHCGEIDEHYHIEDSEIADAFELSWRYKCKKCNKKFSVTSGTWLGNHKLEMEYWWRTAWLLGDFNMEVNSHWLSRDLGLTQVTTHLMLRIIAKSLSLKASTPLKTSKDTFDIMKALLTIRQPKTNN